MNWIWGNMMYERFNHEKRALFREAEAYGIIYELWRVYSLHLIAIKKKYSNYYGINLNKTWRVRPRLWRLSHYMGSRFQRSGMVICKRRKLWRRERKILVVDYIENKGYCPNGAMITPDPCWHNGVGILGINLDLIQELEPVIDLIEAATKHCVDMEKARVVGLQERLNRR